MPRKHLIALLAALVCAAAGTVAWVEMDRLRRAVQTRTPIEIRPRRRRDVRRG